MKRFFYKDILVYILATLLVCLVLWEILSSFILIDWSLILSLETSIEYFFAQRALIGTAILAILSLVASLLYELEKTPKSFAANVLKISLSIYFGLYWFYNTSYLWVTKTNFVFEVDFAFVAWPLLLWINAIAMALVIIIEPWQSVFTKLGIFESRSLIKKSMVNTAIRII